MSFDKADSSTLWEPKLRQRSARVVERHLLLGIKVHILECCSPGEWLDSTRKQPSQQLALKEARVSGYSFIKLRGDSRPYQIKRDFCGPKSWVAGRGREQEMEVGRKTDAPWRVQQRRGSTSHKTVGEGGKSDGLQVGIRRFTWLPSRKQVAVLFLLATRHFSFFFPETIFYNLQ